MEYLTKCTVGVLTPNFAKKDIFDSKNIFMRENFASVVFPKISDEIPSGNIYVKVRHALETDMKNINEIGTEGMFSLSEWVQTLYFNIVMQGKCFDVDSGAMNVSYVNVGGIILAIYAIYNGSIWYLGANNIDGKIRDGNRTLISKEIHN